MIECTIICNLNRGINRFFTLRNALLMSVYEDSHAIQQYESQGYMNIIHPAFFLYKNIFYINSKRFVLNTLDS